MSSLRCQSLEQHFPRRGSCSWRSPSPLSCRPPDQPLCCPCVSLCVCLQDGGHPSENPGPQLPGGTAHRERGPQPEEDRGGNRDQDHHLLVSHSQKHCKKILIWATLTMDILGAFYVLSSRPFFVFLSPILLFSLVLAKFLLSFSQVMNQF